MARLRIFDAAPEEQFWAALPAPVTIDRIQTKTATTFRFTVAEDGPYVGWSIELKGTGFKYLNNDLGVSEPTDGVITSLTIRNGTSNTVFVADQFPAAERPELAEIYAILFDTGGDWHLNTWDMLSIINRNNDTIIGSSRNDNVLAGFNYGDDTVMAMGGDDFVKGDPGNDTLDGGDGFDTLSFIESFYSYAAFRGINLNTTTGTVTDCWGGTDTFINFEVYQGSRFRDIMIGSSTNLEEFCGLRGADTIDGKGGDRDIARYDLDERYGGKRGIICNLDDGTGTGGNIKGTIRDGFGHTDTVLNIERVYGTSFNDKFTGSASSNVFLGNGGKDSYDGKGGWDSVGFWDAESAINVNMALATGQIINDGFGNTETIVNIEGIIGSRFNDTLRGNNGSNQFEGGRGNDTLRGGGGADNFHYFFFEDFGDTVLDFATGIDKVTFYGTQVGLTAGWKFVNSAAGVNDAQSSFYMSGRDLMLDIDGTGTAAAVRVLTIQAGGSIVAGDLDAYF